MAGSKDSCLICSRCFFGKQQFLRCTGCRLRAHTKCVCWPANVDEFLRSGVSSFKCQSCEKISGAARPNGAGMAGGGESDLSCPPVPPSPAGPVKQPAAFPGDLNASVHSQRELLLDALEGISFLTDQVAALRDENAQLRRERTHDAQLQASAINSLRAELKVLRDAQYQKRVTIAKAQGKPQGKPHDTSSHAVVAYSSPPTSVHSNAAPVLGERQDAASPEVNLQHKPTSTHRKARTAARTGASESCKLSVASPSKRRMALFVTKLAPETTCVDISSHLSSLCIEKLECRRLKTRYNTCSSFHVSVDAEYFDKLSDPAVWPKSCLFKPFRGTLHEDLLHASEEDPTSTPRDTDE
ncbi:unnamed protein product [Ixodes hexagonus]